MTSSTKSWIFALQLIPLVTDLIRTAEIILDEGVKKKAFVMDGIKQVVKAMLSVATGGAKATWEIVDIFMEPISDLIDTIVSIMFPHDEETTS